MKIKLEICGKITEMEINDANDFKQINFKELRTYDFIVCFNSENENEKALGCWALNKLLEMNFNLKYINTNLKFYFEA